MPRRRARGYRGLKALSNWPASTGLGVLVSVRLPFGHPMSAFALPMWGFGRPTACGLLFTGTTALIITVRTAGPPGLALSAGLSRAQRFPKQRGRMAIAAAPPSSTPSIRRRGLMSVMMASCAPAPICKAQRAGFGMAGAPRHPPGASQTVPLFGRDPSSSNR